MSTTPLTTPSAVVDALAVLHQDAVDALSGALTRFLREGTPPSPEERAGGAFCYPEVRITYAPDGPAPPVSRAFGKFSQAGTYVSTITRPEFFRGYLEDQLALLMGDFAVTVEVARSTSEIPYAYVWDQAQAAGIESVSPAELARWFPAPDLAHIGDELADGELHWGGEERPSRSSTACGWTSPSSDSRTTAGRPWSSSSGTCSSRTTTATWTRSASTR